MTETRWHPYCGVAPTPADWLARWNLDPLLLAAMLILAGLTMVRLGGWNGSVGGRRRNASRLALGLFAILYLSPLCALSSAFFSVRVFHHMVLVLVLAPLLAFALEPWTRALARPLVAWTLASILVFWAWHAPGPYSAALSSSGVYWLMQLSLLLTATGFWLSIRRAEPALAIGAVLATTVQMGLLGALITFSVRPLYPPHLVSSSSWGVSALADQQLAGLLMWVPGSFAYLLAALLIARRWLKDGTPVRPLPA